MGTGRERMIVHLQFKGGPKVREMLSTEGDVRVDIDEQGRMVGAHFTGVTAISHDGEVTDEGSGDAAS